MDLDLEELASVIEQLDKTEFTDFLFEKGDFRLRVTRGGGNGAAAESAEPAQGLRAVPGPSTAGTEDSVRTGPAPHRPLPAPAPSSADVAAGHGVVTAPMLGTFYGAPKPGAAAFVAVGDVVAEDTVVCIVEVMKLMNSVQAGLSGTVVEVYAKDGDLVEFGQPLFAVRESA